MSATTLSFCEQLDLAFARRSDTSRAAAKSMLVPSFKIRERIYDAIVATGDLGLTCDEVEVVLGLRHQTCSARFFELKNLHAIVDSGLRRPTRSGRMATVWRALVAL